jgi:hypothetical protein
MTAGAKGHSGGDVKNWRQSYMKQGTLALSIQILKTVIITNDSLKSINFQVFTSAFTSFERVLLPSRFKVGIFDPNNVLFPIPKYMHHQIKAPLLSQEPSRPTHKAPTTRSCTQSLLL